MGLIPSAIGNAISGVGTLLKLPDLGIGKAAGGNLSLPGALQGVDPTLYQGVAGVDNSHNPLQVVPYPTGVGAGTTAGGTTAGATSTGGSAPTAAQLAQTQIDQGLAQLPGQLAVGENNILGSYGSALQTLLNGKTTAANNNAATRNQAVQGNITAKAGIDDSVRNTLKGVQQLLGLHGSGNSSASTVLAPFAAATQGNAQRAQVQDTYGTNLTALDNNLNDINTGFDNSKGQLDAQRANEENKLHAGIDQTKAQLLAAESNPDQNQIASLLSQITGLGATPTFTPAPIAAKTPTNNAYAYDPSTAPALSAGVDPTLAQGAGPFWSLLNGLKKQQTGNAALAGS